MGWNRATGYGAKVVYEDGYTEVMQVAKLVELQEKVASKYRVRAYVRWLADKYAAKVSTKLIMVRCIKE